jgi:hypothetical protein
MDSYSPSTPNHEVSINDVSTHVGLTLEEALLVIRNADAADTTARIFDGATGEVIVEVAVTPSGVHDTDVSSTVRTFVNPTTLRRYTPEQMVDMSKKLRAVRGLRQKRDDLILALNDAADLLGVDEVMIDDLEFEIESVMMNVIIANDLTDLI